ncbi:copia protein [Tanacetum coccineum]
MTGNRKLFSTYKAYNGGNVIFGSNLRGNIIGKEPKNVNEALGDESWIVAMQEELNQFIANDVWELVPQPKNMTIIGTKWVFRNKLDENGIVSRNKARLVAQGYNQQEGIDYDETYAPVARLESIRILLAYACALDFKLFQMDVKSAFLNGFINEEVYVAQPPRFIDFEKPDHVYKLKKALYGRKAEPKLKQTALAISTTEAEYVSAGKACQQALWMKQALIDYDVRLDDVPIMCDNKGAIDLSKNPVQHSRTKHIEIRHHFLRDNVQKGHISIEKVPSVDNIADILTKPLKRESFNYLHIGFAYIDKVTMPRKSSEDYKNTRDYIPIILHQFRTPIREKLRNLEQLCIHKGRVVFDNFTDLNYVRSLFEFIEFECLLEINEQVCPRFILEFYSQYQLSYSDEGEMFVEFVIQNQLFSYSLENFAQILGVPCEGACVFSDRWRVDELIYGIPMDGPYQTNLPPVEDIISSIRVDRDGQVRRIRHEEEIDVLEYQVLTREIEPSLKPLEEIIRENVFCLGGNRDHVPACLCFMLYCVVHSEKFNLAYYMAKRMEWVTKQARLLLPYGMLLTRLFTFIMNENPELNNESYVLYDHVMTPLAAQLERKPRRDRGMRRGRHSTSSSSAFDQPSSSHLNDDDDYGNDEGTSRASTPSPIRYVNRKESQKVVEEHEEVRYEGIALRHYYIYYLLNYYA